MNATLRAPCGLQAILDSGEELFTHSYVPSSPSPLLQARLGLAAAIKLAKDSTAFVIEWVEDDLHASGLRELERSKKRQVSLVDHISFLVMRRRDVVTRLPSTPISHRQASGSLKGNCLAGGRKESAK